jgi:hypothetical protein
MWPITPGKYMLSITWEDPPCPGIKDVMGKSGEFTLSYFGYSSVIGVPGEHRINAVTNLNLEEGTSVQLDLVFPCPQ